MCTEPLHIKSPKIKANTFIHGTDRASLTVPCGHCPACVQKRIDDFVFRGFFEYIYTVKLGGFVIFDTLTYSELHVPYNQGFRYFRKRDVQKFLKRLRKNLERNGYFVENLLKYIVTAEYGSKRKRPHYHVLFFVLVRDKNGVPISPDLFDWFVSYSWQHLDKYTNERIEIGRTDDKLVSQRIVNSIYGIRYVCKYVGKGTNVVDAIKYSYSSKSHLNAFVKEYCDTEGLDFYNLKDYQLGKIWKSYLIVNPDIEDMEVQLLPFVLQSHNIGMQFLENSSVEELLDVVNINDYSPKGYKRYNIPLYYIRKAFFDYHPDSKRFILNENGKLYKAHVSDSTLDSLLNFINNNSEIINKKTSEITKGQFNSLDLCVRHFLGERSFEDFLLYVVFLRGKEISPSVLFLDVGNVDISTLSRIQNEIDLDCYVRDSAYFQVTEYSTLFHQRVIRDFKFGELQFYDQLDRFGGFNELYHILCDVRQEFAKAISEKIGLDMVNERKEKSAIAEIQNISQNFKIF